MEDRGRKKWRVGWREDRSRKYEGKVEVNGSNKAGWMRQDRGKNPVHQTDK